MSYRSNNQKPSQRKPMLKQRPLTCTLALMRQQIPGATDRMLRALLEVEHARTELQYADNCLRATLTITPLAAAYAEFVAEGGVTSSDWQTWLQALPLGKRNVLRLKQRPRPDSDDEDEEMEAEEVEEEYDETDETDGAA